MLSRILSAGVAILSALSHLSTCDAASPAVQSISPTPGSTVSSLSQITVTFSAAITGLEASDLLVDAEPATGLSGAGNSWTFVFSQPPAGVVQIGWDGSHSIYDLSGNRFDETGAGATWFYTLIDTTPPTVLATEPAPGATIAALTQLQISFKEPVTGVEAADLRINGQPASIVSGAGAGPYLFAFAQPPDGTITVAWAANHGIVDNAPVPNAFAGGSWNYTLNSSFAGDIVINEIMAENLNGLRDEDGDTSDWIELFNRGANSVNLLGWSLTDDPTRPGQWVFPAVTLNAGQYLLVFASGKDRPRTGPGTNHTSFVLADSEYLGLYNAQLPRQVVSEFAPAYPQQRGDISWGRTASNTYAYFAAATPQAPNAGPTNYSGVADTPHASVASGLFAGAFPVSLSSATPGADIYYTLNGDVPTPASGTLYGGSLMIVGTSNKAVIPLRAAAYKTGLLPSAVLTRTYIFPDQVIYQSSRPAGFPTNWVSEYPGATADTVADYEMDPQVLTNGNNAQIARAALQQIPTISLVTSIDTAFGPTNGVYTGRKKQGNQRPVNVEMIRPDGTRVFQVDCGFEIQGGSSPTDASGDWKDKKLSMRLLFKGDFGTPKLHARVFDDTPVEDFDTLILDAGLNFWWTHMTDSDQRNRAKFITDTITSDLMNNAGMVAQHARYVHVYLDGLYWGLYFLHERMDEAAAASYLGGQKEEWDVLKHDINGLQNGTLTNYSAMFQFATTSNFANNAVYEQFQTFLDVPWFIDYMIVNFWAGNTDWPHHNWYAWRRSRTPGSLPWRFVSWDAEHTFKQWDYPFLSNGNLTAANSPGVLFNVLRNNAEFRVLFGDRIHKLMFNGGPLYSTPDAVAFWSPTNPAVNLPATAYRKRVDEIWDSIVCESARWGDVATVRANQPYTRDLEYTRELDSLFTITNIAGQTPDYFPLRGSNVLAQFRAASLYPTVAAPAFSQHGGRVAPGYRLYLTNVGGAGTVYYTTNGIDPRTYGSGAVAPQAVAYSGTPLTLGQSMVIKARTLNGANWSALNEAVFTVGSLGVPLRITEIMYNPLGGDAHEFIELQNTGVTDLNLGGFSFDGVSFAFPPQFMLAGGARLVLASAVNPASFAARYPGVVVAGYFSGSLANGGERLTLKDASGNTVVSVDYDDANGWPTSPDGAGYSLEIIDLNGNPDDPANWRASSVLNGTPGQPNSAAPAASVVINEAMAENLTVTNNGGVFPDWLELHNSGGTPVDLTGWSLSDNGDPRRFVFTNGPVLVPDDYLVVWCDTNYAGPGFHTGFSLDKDGSSLFLHDPASNRVDAISFGAQLPDLTVGRIGGAWQLNTPTPGAANVAAAVASVTNVVINEWLANAPPGGVDWLELYNRSATQPVALNGIYLGTSNALFRFTSLSFLPPHGFLQLLADESPGAKHLDFKLPAGGGAILLFDTAGREIDRVTYGAQGENVSSGRLPDGSGGITSFPATASPAAGNYLLSYSGPILNEVLVINGWAVTNGNGRTADFVELRNTNATAFDLTGMRLSNDPENASQWFFPAGVSIAANGYLVVWFDNELPASVVNGPVLNTGQSLDGESGQVWLFNSAGQPVDGVVFGFQVADLPIGLSGGQWMLLGSATPGAANAAPAALGSAGGLRINEWSANPVTGSDWFEIYNSASQPVSLTGLYLTDDPSLIGATQFPVGPLSYIGANGFVKCIADADRSQGGNHVNFSLDGEGELLRIASPTLGVIDTVSFGAQGPGVSEGRLPDGSENVESFAGSGTPAASNYRPLAGVVVNEVLAASSDPLEDAIEIYNGSGQGVDLSGWFLSDGVGDFKKYRIGDGTFLAAGGYVVFYEGQFGAGPGGFALDGVRGGQVHLSEADAAGHLSGRRAVAHYGAAANGVSWGRWETCTGVDFTVLSGRSFGQDAPGSVGQFRTGGGLFNAPAQVGPVVINELMYHPPAGGTNVDNTLDEYIELYNLSGSAVTLYDAGHPANTWRLRNAVSFVFPGGVTVPAGGYVLVVNFDPVGSPGQLAAFRGVYGVSSNVPVYGPYGGKLDNGGESVELYRPEGPPGGSSYVPYVLVDRVEYGDAAPWPVGGDGDGASLQRAAASEYGNDAANWLAAGPTAGRANAAAAARGPSVVAQPISRAVSAGSRVMFNVSVCGSRPLSYQWKFNGATIPNATNAAYLIGSAQAGQAGNYTVQVSNGAGNVLSEAASLALMDPPVITTQPQSQTVGGGMPVTFTVAASGSGPLNYQWRRNGIALAGATNGSLSIAELRREDAGDYSVLVGNAAGAVASAAATLNVLIPPNITVQPQSQVVSTNTTVTFTVAATGVGLLRYQWQFNGANLPGATSATLTLSNVNLSHEGDYRVLVTDDITTGLSVTARLTVKVPPVVLVGLRGQTNAVGTTITLSVSASGSVPMGFSWRKVGIGNPLTNIVLMTTNSTFTIFNAQTNDSGTYRCILTNSGNVTPGVLSSAALLILAPPVLTNLPVSQVVQPGANVTFNAGAAGSGPLYYRWQFQDADLPGATNTTLSLTNVQPANQGQYRVIVTNQLASASATATLTVGNPNILLQDIQWLANGTVRMKLSGVPNRNHAIEISATLSNWTTLDTLFYTNGLMPFIDSTVSPTTNRFYRARLAQ